MRATLYPELAEKIQGLGRRGQVLAGIWAGKGTKEIAADMGAPRPMARLLQGDVGSGKTLVAFLACLDAVETGGQAALMAPTELLARQHAATAARLIRSLGKATRLPTGGDPWGPAIR